MKPVNQGFTLIEVTMVIVIVGILAAIAIPKFANLTTQARNSTNRALGGGLTSAISIAHAAWIALGAPAAGGNVTLEGAAVHVNGSGWPDNSKGTAPLAADCAVIWTALLNAAPIAGCTTCTQTCTAASTNNCYIASAATSICTFTLSTNNANTITYDTSAGAVVITP